MISYILAVFCGAIFLAVDQYTKYLVSTNFAIGESKEFIKGFIDLIYIHNTGGAWGILEGHTWGLLAITVVLIIICFALLLKLGKNNKIVFWAVSFILFGGIGNMIDRIFRDGNVVDFLHFEFFPQFPVFNIADCAIVIGACMLILYYIIDCINDSKVSKAKFLTTEQENESD